MSAASVAQRTVLDALDRPRRDTAADAAEGADRLVPDEQARAVAAQRVGAGREGRVEGVEVVGEDRPLVGLERGEQVGGQISRRSRVTSSCSSTLTPSKSASRMRACTPHTMSTTCEMSKSVAALR